MTADRPGAVREELIAHSSYTTAVRGPDHYRNAATIAWVNAGWQLGRAANLDPLATARLHEAHDSAGPR